MRKFLLPSALLSLCILLIVFSDACLVAAADALSAWWERVLPALLPFSVFLSLSDRAGIFRLFERLCRPIAAKCRCSASLLPCMLFGMLSGYPNGARLVSMRGIPFAAAFCSFCSPVFMIGVVAKGLYGSKQLILPLILSHIGGVLFSALCIVLAQRASLQTKLHVQSRSLPISHTNKNCDFFSMLRESLAIMASIGGCMVLFSVGLAMIEQLHLLSPIAQLLQSSSVQEKDLLALLHGIFEFAGGCVSIAALTLPLRLRIALTAFTITFGGLCVILQTAMFLDKDALRHYAWIKLLQGILAAGIAYVLFPLLCPSDIAAMAPDAESMVYAANALSMGSILLSSCIVLLSFYLFALSIARFSQDKAKKKTCHM